MGRERGGDQGCTHISGWGCLAVWQLWWLSLWLTAMWEKEHGSPLAAISIGTLSKGWQPAQASSSWPVVLIGSPTPPAPDLVTKGSFIFSVHFTWLLTQTATGIKKSSSDQVVNTLSRAFWILASFLLISLKVPWALFLDPFNLIFLCV